MMEFTPLLFTRLQFVANSGFHIQLPAIGNTFRQITLRITKELE